MLVYALRFAPPTPPPPNLGFTLFTNSEVRQVRCDYVMQYSNVCKRESWSVRNIEKQGEGEIYVKLVKNAPAK